MILFCLHFFYYLCTIRVITLEHNNEELRNTNGCYLVTQFSSNPTNRFILSELSFLAKVKRKKIAPQNFCPIFLFFPNAAKRLKKLPTMTSRHARPTTAATGKTGAPLVRRVAAGVCLRHTEKYQTVTFRQIGLEVARKSITFAISLYVPARKLRCDALFRIFTGAHRKPLG